MASQLGEQQALLFEGQRIGSTFVGMPLHLNQRRCIQPGLIGLVTPESRTEIQDAPDDREIAIDGSRTSPSTQAVPYIWLQSAVMNPVKGQVPDVRVHRSKRPCIPFEAALVLILVQELDGSFPKDALLSSSEEMRGPHLLDPPREYGYGFLEIARSSAFANARSKDVFIDVPDSTALGEA
jgi:hypothetical protein